MKDDERRGIAHFVLSFVSLTFLIYGTLFLTACGFQGYEPIILPLIEFGSALSAGIIGGIAYWLRALIERRSPTQPSRWALALLLALASGTVWFLALWYANLALPIWLSGLLSAFAAAMSLTIFVAQPPGAWRSIPSRTAFVRATGFTAASFGVALGLPWVLAFVFPHAPI